MCVCGCSQFNCLYLNSLVRSRNECFVEENCSFEEYFFDNTADIASNENERMNEGKKTTTHNIDDEQTVKINERKNSPMAEFETSVLFLVISLPAQFKSSHTQFSISSSRARTATESQINNNTKYEQRTRFARTFVRGAVDDQESASNIQSIEVYDFSLHFFSIYTWINLSFLNEKFIPIFSQLILCLFTLERRRVYNLHSFIQRNNIKLYVCLWEWASECVGSYVWCARARLYKIMGMLSRVLLLLLLISIK